MSKIFTSAFFLMLATPLFAQAFRLTPMVIHFTPGGNKATQVVTLENPNNEKIPIQIEAFVRGTDTKGEETRVKTDEFIIYPEQLVLLPNEKRNVRITWSGDLSDGDEKAYRIVASQLPVEFQEKNSAQATSGANLNFLLQYVASAYVTPKGAVAKVKVKEVKKHEGKKISMTVVNEGNAHKVLHAKSIKLFAGEKLLQQVSNIKDVQNTNLLPKTEKTFVFTLGKEVKESNLRGEIEFAEVSD